MKELLDVRSVFGMLVYGANFDYGNRQPTHTGIVGYAVPPTKDHGRKPLTVVHLP
jgi:hypothetical protein